MTLSPDDLRLLEVALQTLLPSDSEAEFAIVRGFVSRTADRFPDQYRTGLILLREHGFEGLEASERIAMPERLEGHPSLALMAQHAVEGFYTSPLGFGAVGFRVTA